MPAPSDSFIADYVRAESAVSATALDLALGRRKRVRTGKSQTIDLAKLPLALDLVASGTLSLERYLEPLSAHDRRRAKCPGCGNDRYASRSDVKPAPCPGCGEVAPPVEGRVVTGADAPEGELRFEDYTIEAELGRGGMGIVYRALYRPAQRVDALKLLLPQSTLSEDRVARFRRERALTARLQHRAIVAIHRAGEHGGLEFLALELVPGGKTLRTLIETGPQPIGLSCRILAEAARGVDAAHRAGVLHRDLKPENVLLDLESKPHVADFGLARALDDATQLTQSGTMVGTPLYMPLEQLQGRRDLDERCDVYALGCCLYELLVGAHPHSSAKTLPQLVDSVKEDAIEPPRARRSEVPAALERVVLQALSPDRDRRPRTALELALAIEHAVPEPGSGRPPSGANRSRGLAWHRDPRARVAAALGGVIVVALGLALALSTSSKPDPAADPLAPASALDERARAARPALDAIRHAEEVARLEGRGSFQDLETARVAFEKSVAALGAAPSEIRAATDPVAAARHALAVARVRALLLNPGDDAPREALALVDASPERDSLVAERGDALLDLGRPKEALAAFESALARKPVEAGHARLGRAHALVRLAREGEAREELALVARALGTEAWDAWVELAALDPDTRVPPPPTAGGAAPTPTEVALARARGRPRAEAWLAIAAVGSLDTPGVSRARAGALLVLGLPEVAAEVAGAGAAAAREPLEVALLRTIEGEALLLANRATQAAEPLRLAVVAFDRPLPGTNDPLERRRAARAGKARALVAQGDASRSKGDLEGARQRYELAAHACPAVAVPRARLAEMILARRDPDRAVSEAWAGLDVDARSSEAASALVQASEDAGRTVGPRLDPGLVPALERALGAASNGPAAPEARADLLIARAHVSSPSDPVLGRAFLEEARAFDRLDPFTIAVRAQVGVARLTSEGAKGTVARGLAEARLLARPRSPALLAALAQSCLASAAYPEANQNAQLAIALDPELGEGHLALADYLAYKLLLPESILEYGAAMRGGAPRVDVELGLGFTLMRAERGREALPAFDDAIRWEPFWAPIYGGRAAALKALGRLDESDADRDRQASFTTAPDREWLALRELARKEAAARPEVAAPLFEELLRSRPGDGTLWFHRGLATARGHETLLGLALLGRAIYGVPRLEADLAAALDQPRISGDPLVAEALMKGVPDRPDLSSEAAFVAGVVELQRAASAPPDEAIRCQARALLDLERSVAERPTFHAARIFRGLARSLVGGPRSGVADVRLAFELTDAFHDETRALLGIVLARASDPDAEAELRRAFAAGDLARRRFELDFLPASLRPTFGRAR